jgi:hypothetical protein
MPQYDAGRLIGLRKAKSSNDAYLSFGAKAVATRSAAATIGG